MAQSRTIWSLGTSNRSLAEFVAVLKHYRIETVADVRHFPKSRFGHFRRETFDAGLAERGIAYVWLGEELGGYRKGGYEAYMRTDGFLRGLARLEALAAASRTAFVCAERLPWRCHRRFVGQALAARGWDVQHVIEAGQVWQPREQLRLETP
jgi:uncharacterized protein (DUF488 family)